MRELWMRLQLKPAFYQMRLQCQDRLARAPFLTRCFSLIRSVWSRRKIQSDERFRVLAWIRRSLKMTSLVELKVSIRPFE